MLQNNTAAIYYTKTQNELINYIKQRYKNYCAIYDDLSNPILDNLPRFHYTEINNRGYDVYIDDLNLVDRLKNKNNKIIYYKNNYSNHNINYIKLHNLIQSVDAILLNNKEDEELTQIIFDYTKELMYV